jgi:hypothetical protein
LSGELPHTGGPSGISGLPIAVLGGLVSLALAMVAFGARIRDRVSGLSKR